MWKKIIASIISFTLLGLVWLTSAVTVVVPRETINDPDYQIPDGHTTELAWKTSITDIISLVNSYLRFAIWFVCFLFMIWNGYQLIMARGDDKQLKTATKALIWSALWLTVCLLAYIIVNIAVKFFQ